MDFVKWVWFAEAMKTGNQFSDELLHHYNYNIQAIYDADEQEYELLQKKSPEKIRALTDKDLSEAEKIVEYCRANNIGLLPVNVRDYYPARLRRITGKPILLYYKTNRLIPLDNRLCIGMVGTRRMTEYGRRTAYTTAHDLSKAGAIVVSGMALGVDAMCHAGALDAGKPTIAVLGCGIDRAYPPENAELMERILQCGMVVTEYPPFSLPKGVHFPIRNRIISGLSQCVVYVEGDERSGAMITARRAFEQGRRVFAIPGKLGESSSKGANVLLKDGAQIVTEPWDILHYYEQSFGDTLNIRPNQARTLDKKSRDLMQKLTPSPEVQQKQKETEKKKAQEERLKALKEEQAESDPLPGVDRYQSASDTEPAGLIDSEVPSAPAPAKTDDYVMDEYEKTIYGMICQSEPMSIDRILSAGIPIQKIMISLTKLEIAGYIRTESGGNFVRVRKSE